VFLFLNDVSGSEVLLILVFILIFFGSKSIPGIARTVGRTMRQIQDATSDIKSEITKSAGDYKKDLNLDGIFRETAEEIQRPLDQMVDDLDHSIKYTPPRKNIQNPVEPLVEIPNSEENTETDNKKTEQIDILNSIDEGTSEESK
jgi:Sec-independent protein translocase protein TatA